MLLVREDSDTISFARAMTPSVTRIKLARLRSEEHTAGFSLSRLAACTSRRIVFKMFLKPSDLISI